MWPECSIFEWWVEQTSPALLHTHSVYTFSWEWWYIQRRAAEVMVGFSEPYAVSNAFRTKPIAWKWLFFQYLVQNMGADKITTRFVLTPPWHGQTRADRYRHWISSTATKRTLIRFLLEVSLTCPCMLQPSCCQRIVQQAGNHLCLHNDTSLSEDPLVEEEYSQN